LFRSVGLSPLLPRFSFLLKVRNASPNLARDEWFSYVILQSALPTKASSRPPSPLPPTKAGNSDRTESKSQHSRVPRLSSRPLNYISSWTFSSATPDSYPLMYSSVFSILASMLDKTTGQTSPLLSFSLGMLNAFSSGLDSHNL